MHMANQGQGLFWNLVTLKFTGSREVRHLLGERRGEGTGKREGPNLSVASPVPLSIIFSYHPTQLKLIVTIVSGMSLL